MAWDLSRALRWVPVAAALAIAAVVLLVGAGAQAAVPAPLLDDSAPPGWSVLAALLIALPVGDHAALLGLSALGAGLSAWLLIRLVVDSGHHPLADLTGGVAGAMLMCASSAWLAPAAAAGPASVKVALALGAITALDRVARGGGARAGMASALCLGWLVAMAPTSRWLLLPLVALIVVRVRHGARWPLLLPAVILVVWALALVQWALLPTAPSVPSPPGVGVGTYLERLGDTLGPVAMVAALAGGLALLGRGRRSRWLAVSVAMLLLAGLRADLVQGQPGPLVVVAAAVAAAVGVARMAARVRLPSAQLWVGATCAALVATPAVAFALASGAGRAAARGTVAAEVSSRGDDRAADAVAERDRARAAAR